MSKISFNQTNDKIMLCNTLSTQEEINQREFDMIKTNKISGLLEVFVSVENDDILIQTQLEKMIPWRTYYQNCSIEQPNLDHARQSIFFKTVLQLVQIMMECTQNFLDETNLFLDLDYIFVDTETSKIKCILWPVTNNEMKKNPIDFLRALPTQIKLQDKKEEDYYNVYDDLFKTRNSFSMNAFLRSLLNLSEKPLALDNIEKHPLPNSALPLEKNAKKTNLQDDIEKEKSPSKQKNRDKIASSVSQQRENFASFPYIMREKNQEIIFVNKFPFRIGKQKQENDLYISDNPAISRSHAEIINRNGEYFILDKNSTNKTKVEGVAVEPDKEIRLDKKVAFRLANETFTFHMLHTLDANTQQRYSNKQPQQ